MQKHHTRRKRRQAKMKIRSKGKFKVNHTNPAGRTGSIQSKRTPGERATGFFSGLTAEQKKAALEYRGEEF